MINSKIAKSLYYHVRSIRREIFDFFIIIKTVIKSILNAVVNNVHDKFHKKVYNKLIGYWL